MKVAAKEIMSRKFHVLTPEIPVSEAVKRFLSATEAEGRRIFGMMVVDEGDCLIGMLSMYDILLFIRPKHIHVWGGMTDVDIAGLVENACEQAKKILVGDIMSTDMITVSPETHLMVVLDLMVKKHVRRIPVLNGEKIEGILYISDLFNYLVDELR